MVVNSPLIRPAISWGKRGIGKAPLDSHDYTSTLKMHTGKLTAKKTQSHEALGEDFPFPWKGWFSGSSRSFSANQGFLSKPRISQQTKDFSADMSEKEKPQDRLKSGLSGD